MKGSTASVRSAHEFHYRLRQPAAAHVPGAHRSRRGDMGLEFRGHVPLSGATDLRRIDFHASLRDAFGQWQVKVFSERKAVSVIVVADLSASMAYVGAHRKLDVLADFTEAAARSAWRHGDAFGFVGADSALRSDWVVPATRRRGLGEVLAQRLRVFQPQGTAEGLAQAMRVLPLRRSLVFVVSDYHFPLPQIDRLVGGMAAHEVVPVLLWDRHEFDPPADGLVQLADPESGAQRLVWMRPWLRSRWADALQRRRDELQQVFARHRLEPLLLDDGYRADRVSAHFIA